jgi:hypothetical protein
MHAHECYTLSELMPATRIADKHMFQKYITRHDDPMPFVCIIGASGSQKYGFPRAETDAWLERNGYRGAK